MCFIHFNPFHPSLVICEKKIYIPWPHEVLTKCPRAVLATSRTWVTCFSGHLCEENLDMSSWYFMMSCLNLSNNSDSCIVIWAHIVIQHTKNSRQMDWIHQVPLTGQDSSRKASSRAFNIRCTRAEVKCSLKGVGANGEPGRNSINSAQTSEMLKWCAVQVNLMFQTSDSSVCQRTCYTSCEFRNAVAGSLSDKATIHDNKEPTKERKYTKGPKIISKQKCTGFFQFSTCSFHERLFWHPSFHNHQSSRTAWLGARQASTYASSTPRTSWKIQKTKKACCVNTSRHHNAPHHAKLLSKCATNNLHL